jgi:hypothetical protein
LVVEQIWVLPSFAAAAFDDDVDVDVAAVDGIVAVVVVVKATVVQD